MPGLLSHVDPDGLLEYSVVYTDRSLNHMSERFQGVMRDLSKTLKQVYGARSAIVVPGSGTFGMEAVARQFASGRSVLVVRNGWFSYRWSQIFQMGDLVAGETVLKARRIGDGPQAAFAPAPVADVVTAIERERPAVVFVPHVETASGLILPDDYLVQVAAATRSVDGIFVVDCVASGAIWLDMGAIGIDVLISAPQKGWSSSPCCALVMLGERARERIESTRSSSYSCDLRKWLQIMEAYEGGGHLYHATLPTDSLAILRDTMVETGRPGLRPSARRAARAGHQGALAAGDRRLSQRRGLRIRGSGGRRELYHRSRDPDGTQVPPTRAADCGRRPVAVRRTRGLPDLPHRPVRTRQAAERRADGPDTRHGVAARPVADGSLTGEGEWSMAGDDRCYSVEVEIHKTISSWSSSLDPPFRAGSAIRTPRLIS